METIQTFPSVSPQGPLTMTSFLENSGTGDSCHHLEDRAESKADCVGNAIPSAQNGDNCSQSSTSMHQKRYYSFAQGAEHNSMSHFKIQDLLCGCLLLT